MFSQFGEVVDLHLPRRKTVVPGQLGVRMGFAFLAFEDQRSTVLAIDNMNGWEMVLPKETRPRILRVDHAGRYRRPKGPAADNSGSLEEKAFDDVETNDAAYDERRKQIWDYEKYGTLDDGRRKPLAVGELPAFDDLSGTADQTILAPASASHVSANDSKEDAHHADRVMAMLAEKQRQRERAKRGGDDAGGASAAASSSAAAAAASSSSRAAPSSVPSRFGDPSAAAASSSRDHRSRSPHRSSDRRRSRSRSSDRHRHKDKKRSRSRDRDRR
jgi:RNA-binding motif X-linked protein 2